MNFFFFSIKKRAFNHRLAQLDADLLQISGSRLVRAQERLAIAKRATPNRLDAEQRDELHDGHRVVDCLEERIPTREEAQKYHTRTPYVDS